VSSRKLGLFAAAAGLVTVSALGIYLGLGAALVKPSRRPIPPPPPSLQATVVKIPSASGATLVAWLSIPPTPRGAVLVLHGVRADRATMLSRARLLREEGFAVLVPDLQAHGESTGDRITFGFLEAKDAEACVTYLQGRFRDLPIAAVGVSMGGAALALGGNRLPLRGAVLEAVYPTVEEATDNRVRRRVGPLATVLAPLLLLQLGPQLGISPDELRPIEAVKTIRYPLLVISGTADLETTEAQTRALYAAAHPPKELWLVHGAKHVDLLRYDPEGYRRRVLGFLRRHVLARARDSAVGSGT
jgi:alpha-beta hydrolase superfamily lysophospholipase